VKNINPELHGMTGEVDACGSAVAHLFAKALDKGNYDLAPLAIVGSAEIPEYFRGLNRIALDDAVKAKAAREVGSGNVRIVTPKGEFSFKRLSTLISVLGSVGYYQGGPNRAVNACLKGLDKETERIAKELEERRRTANKKLLSELQRNGLMKENGIQWFHAEDTFDGMGTKVIVSFCSYLSFQRLVNPAKYLVGIMNMSPEIPSFGKLQGDYVKVSGRAPRILRDLITKGSKPPLSVILPRACEKHGGFGHGHSVAASGVFVRGEEESFARTLAVIVQLFSLFGLRVSPALGATESI
jgi:hypothetical protein